MIDHVLELYMGKIDHEPYQKDDIQANNNVQGPMGEMTNQLRNSASRRRSSTPVDAMLFDEARAFLDSTPIERRALYEEVKGESS